MVAFWAVGRRPRFLLLLALRAAVSRAPLQAGYGGPEACLPRRNAVNRSSAADFSVRCSNLQRANLKLSSECAEAVPLVVRQGTPSRTRWGDTSAKTPSTQKTCFSRRFGQQKSTLASVNGCNRRELLKLLSPCVPFTSGAAKNAAGQPKNTLSPHQPK